jgi:DNA-binding XRE family transcriptional regulator
MTQAQAAEQMNVSPRSVNAARRVRSEGCKELQDAMSHGKVSASAAAILSLLPEEEQRTLVARGSHAMKEKAKEVRKKRSETRARLKALVHDSEYGKLLERALRMYDRLPDVHRKSFLWRISKKDPLPQWLTELKIPMQDLAPPTVIQ